MSFLKQKMHRSLTRYNMIVIFYSSPSYQPTSAINHFLDASGETQKKLNYIPTINILCTKMKKKTRQSSNLPNSKNIERRNVENEILV